MTHGPKVACKNHIISEYLDFFFPQKRFLAQIRAFSSNFSSLYQVPRIGAV
jgi:hypothetical protein